MCLSSMANAVEVLIEMLPRWPVNHCLLSTVFWTFGAQAFHAAHVFAEGASPFQSRPRLGKLPMDDKDMVVMD